MIWREGGRGGRPAAFPPGQPTASSMPAPAPPPPFKVGKGDSLFSRIQPLNPIFVPYVCHMEVIFCLQKATISCADRAVFDCFLGNDTRKGQAKKKVRLRPQGCYMDLDHVCCIYCAEKRPARAKLVEPLIYLVLTASGCPHKQVPDSIVVRTPGFHPGNPGSLAFTQETRVQFPVREYFFSKSLHKKSSGMSG